MPRQGILARGALALLAHAALACTTVSGLDALEFAPLASSSSGQGGSASSAGGAAGASSTGATAATGGGGQSDTYFFVVDEAGPLAWWRLGDASGAQASDSAGVAHGSFEGGVSLGEPGIPGAGADTAARFDGIDAQVVFGDVFDFAGAAPFSLEAWVKPDPATPPSNRFAMCDKSGRSGDEGYTLYLEADKAPRFKRYNAGAQDSAKADVPLELGVFSHVVGSYDGTELKLYVNGVLASAVSDRIVPMIADTTHPLVLGVVYQQDHLLGVLDEVAVYDYALSPEQVAAHHAAGITD